MNVKCVLLPTVLAGSLVQGAEPSFQATLLDTRSGVWTERFAVDHTLVDTGSGTAWSVRKHTLRGGRQEGVEVIEVDNGRMRFSVVPTRGMNVHKVHCGGVELGWKSPVTELVNPAFINPADRGGLGWLEGFNEWMARCGYEFAGHPGEDDGRLLTLHGKASNLPASRVEVVVDGRRIHIRGRVEERMFKFSALELVTDISTEIGSNVIRFDDVLTNRGATPQEFEVIYHSNYGEPLLEKGARFVAPVRSVTPFDERAAEEVVEYAVFQGPTPGYGEAVHCMELFADADGRTTVMLHNKAGDRGVSMRYAVDSLPYFTLWKNTDVGEKGYVTGLEPGTGYPYNRSVERERGRVKTLKPGEGRRFLLDVEVLADTEAVARTAKAIASIQGDRKTTVNREPEQ